MPSMSTGVGRSCLKLVVAAVILTGFALFFITSGSRAADIGIGDKNVEWGWGPGEGPAGDYDFPNENCTGGHTDPVGVLFVGKRAGVTNVALHLERHNGLDRNVGVENLEGVKHSLLVRNDKGSLECKILNTANANDDDFSDRHHIRLWGIPGSKFPEVMTVGTPHHEDFLDALEAPGCAPGNHAINENGSVGKEHGPNASGFDWARHEVGFYFSHPNWKNPSADSFGGDHRVVNEYWGIARILPSVMGRKPAATGGDW